MTVLFLIGAVIVTVVMYVDKVNHRIQQMETERNIALELYFKSMKELVPMGIDSIWTSNFKYISLDVLTSKGPRLCLFLHKSQCDLCRNEALEYFEECGSLYKWLKPVVLLSGFKPNDLIQMEHSYSFPLFLVDERWEIDAETQKDYPILMVLNQKGKINYVFPLEDKSPYIKEEYVKRVNAYCQTSNRKPRIRAINANIQLGNIELRRKVVVKLLLENVSSQDCKVVNIEPSCDCIRIEDFTKVIYAESKGFVKVTLVPERKGTLYRTVSVKLASAQTVDFEINANVI